MSVPEASPPLGVAVVLRSYEQTPSKQGWVQSFLAWTVWVDKRSKRSGRRVCERLVGIVFQVESRELRIEREKKKMQ